MWTMNADNSGGGGVCTSCNIFTIASMIGKLLIAHNNNFSSIPSCCFFLKQKRTVIRPICGEWKCNFPQMTTEQNWIKKNKMIHWKQTFLFCSGYLCFNFKVCLFGFINDKLDKTAKLEACSRSRFELTKDLRWCLRSVELLVLVPEGYM